ncbi:MAG: hypothetical protein F7C33_04420 [Desulfurococcales archaeon]|nr:hypothetical protein [Desulfurococcales archaeon]
MRLEFQYPPFRETSPLLAAEIVNGRLEYYSEPLSINGHAYYVVDANNGSPKFAIYWVPRPLTREATREWETVAYRVIRFRSRHEPYSESIVEGQVRYEYRPGGEKELAELIGEARRIAGLTPVPAGNLADTATGYASRGDAGNEAASALLEALLDLVDDPEILGVIVENDLLTGPVNITRASNTYDIPKATLHRILRHLAKIGAVKACNSRRKKHEYYVNLRSELILTLIAQILIGIDKHVICRIAPYIEGVSHKDWVVFPSGYEACESASMELRRLEANLDLSQKPKLCLKDSRD